jgi:glycosyltransferase involved in cell wall biosynthesis
MTANVFLTEQIKKLAGFYDVTVVANLSSKKYLLKEISKFANIKNIPIKREIELFNDFKALLLLMVYLNREKFSLVHSVSPKAGFLAMLASWLVRVPVRINTYTGQPWATRKGLMRNLLRIFDKVIYILATKILVDSNSQLTFLKNNKIISKSSSKAIVIGKGSISGVDLSRFKVDSQVRSLMRKKLGVNQSTFILLFVGRIKKDKGILELVKAFSIIHQEYENSALWCVGPDEDDLREELELVEGVRIFSYTEEPENYMTAADLFCMPSYREGFGTAVIEAAACGIPSIGTNIYGLVDAVVDGKTGIIIEPKDYLALTSSIKMLIENEKLRKTMGKAARLRAHESFSNDFFTKEIIELYKILIQNSPNNR